MRIAAVQMNSKDNKEKNLLTALQLVDKAANNGADLIVLPEYVDFIGSNVDKYSLAESIPGPTSMRMAEKAKERAIYLHGGSILEKAGNGRVFNTSVFINPDGEIIAKYRKIHLYDATFKERYEVTESDITIPGDEIETANTIFGKIGLTICYDLRFPELFRLLALRGCKVIVVPAAFPLYTGAHHWEILLRARAIENQCYIVAAAQHGNTPIDIVQYGKSMIIDPWGTVIASSQEKVGFIIQDVDFDYLENIRRSLPSLEHRRPDVYTFS